MKVRHVLLGVCCLAVTSACGPATETDPDPDPAPTFETGGAPVRALTNTEYAHTIRDLLGVAVDGDALLPAEPVVMGFDNNARALTVDVARASAYMRAAEAIAAETVASLGDDLGCPPELSDLECGAAFIEDYAARAYRRPLEPEEQTILAELFQTTLTEDDRRTAGELVLSAILQSPPFLYRLERSDAEIDGLPGVVALDSHEVATRLAYLLWASTPDAELRSAADSGGLTTPTEIEAQARRMLADERSRDALDYFHRQWLGLDDLEAVDRLDPAWSPELAGRMQREALSFVNEVMQQGSGSLTELLTASFTVGDADLATLYGAADVPGDGEWRRFELDPSQRAGLLTMGGVLARHAHPGQTSIVHRGLFVLERLLCFEQEAPPADVDLTLPPIDPSLSTRERFARHRQEEVCRSCHENIDPIGLGFEHYDPIGRWRELEGSGVPVDAHGYVQVDGAVSRFYGVRELADLLADSEEVSSCYVTQWFRFAFGRGEVDEDAETLAELRRGFAASGQSVEELLVAITQSQAFRTRPAPEEDTP